MTRLRTYLVDDEPLALKRLERLLKQTQRIDIIGMTTDPDEALEYLLRRDVDALFLDIRMPGMTGFDLLSRLPIQPPVVFTTAHEEYALSAFEVNTFDYLLKPVEVGALNRAIAKLERLRGNPQRLASRIGVRVIFVDIGDITHFYARDKLTFAATTAKDYVIDSSINDLEQRLDPSLFMRIHRSRLINLRCVGEVVGSSVRLKDEKRTVLYVARNRLRELIATLAR